MGDRTAPGPPPWGRVCAGHLAFYRGEHAHGQQNTNDSPGGSHPRGYFILPNVQVISAGFRRIPGRPGGGQNPKTGGKGPGRKRSVWVAESLVGTGGKFRGTAFWVCSNGRVFSAGFPKRGPKTPRFLPITEPGFTGMQRARSSSTASPIYEGCARMNPLGPRTGRGRKRERRVPRCPRPGAASRGPKNSIWHRSMAVRGPP